MPFISSKLTSAVAERKAARTGGSSYLNPTGLGDGETVRFAPLGTASLTGWEAWLTTSEGKRKPCRFNDEPTVSELSERAKSEGGSFTDQYGNPSKPKLFIAFFVWNYEHQQVQLFQASQSSIVEQLENQLSDQEVAEDMESWDLELTRAGTGLDTRYTLMLKPGRRKRGGKLTAEGASAQAAWEAAEAEGYNLEALLTGGDPFKAGAGLF
ncbi:MAG: hypothetical protein ACO29V_10785 [Limnohabitans sp.]